MYLGCKSRKSEIFKRLSLLKNIDNNTLIKLLTVATKNDTRGLIDSKVWNLVVLRLNSYVNISIDEVCSKLEDLIPSGSFCISNIKLNKSNWVKQIRNHFVQIEIYCKHDDIKIAFFQNLFLIKNNMLPLLHFAFSKWHIITSSSEENQILDLFEFSLHYLTKLIPIKTKNDKKGILIGSGSYNNVFYNCHEAEVYKIPTNFGAMLYVNRQEYLINKTLLSTKLSKYIPKKILFKKKDNIIMRDRVFGKSGHELLDTDFFISTPNAVKELNDFFSTYTNIINKFDFRLDIHPGNFLWSDTKQKWTFMDLGPIPKIGSEYFPLESFDEYFNKIWLDRKKLMKTVPIRSVDIFE